jgi:FtsZ-binding cell division protein ZapB
MTTASEHVDPSAQAAPAGTELLPEEAQATVEEIKAENAALEEAEQAAEAEAEAVAEQARQLAEVTAEVLDELRDGQEGHSPA